MFEEGKVRKGKGERTCTQSTGHLTSPTLISNPSLSRKLIAAMRNLFLPSSPV
jgi:hypothetical protein